MEVVEINSNNEGTVDLGSANDDGGNSLPSPTARFGSPEEKEEENGEDELTNRQFNEMFVYHTSPQFAIDNFSKRPLGKRCDNSNTGREEHVWK